MKLLKIIKEMLPIAIALLAAFLTNICPVNFNFIPPDKVYGISLTIYSALFTAIFKGLFYIKNLIRNRKSCVEIKFSESNSKFEELKVVNFDFDPDVDITKVYFKVLLMGNPKKFLEKQIRIELPMQVEAYSIDKYSDYCAISSNKKSITINIAQLFNKNKQNRIEDSQILGFQVLKNYEVVDSGLEVSILENKKKKIKLINNTCFFRR